MHGADRDAPGTDRVERDRQGRMEEAQGQTGKDERRRSAGADWADKAGDLERHLRTSLDNRHGPVMEGHGQGEFLDCFLLA